MTQTEPEPQAPGVTIMSYYETPQDITALDEAGNTTDRLLCTIVKADDTLADKIITAPEGNDGRSPWLWVRLQSGDLLLACFPHGDTYFATEVDPRRP